MSEGRVPWSKLLIPAVIVIATVALVAFVLVYDMGDDGDDQAAAQPNSAEPYPHDIGIERRDAMDPLAFGPVDAPVTMVVFGDYQCPYCAKWSHDTLPAMLKRVQSGQLRIEMRDLSVFGPESRRAAQATYAAALQDRHLQYHNELFAGGEKRSPDELSDQALIDTAADLSLDIAKFRTDMTSASTQRAVDRNESDASAVGAYSTPAFILGGQPMAGAGSTSTYLDKLDALLPEGE